MSTTTITPELSEEASEALDTYASRVAGRVCAARLWDRYLSDQDRIQLGGDGRAAYERDGTAAMWARLHGVTLDRAVVEVASVLNLIADSDRDWLLREIGESADVEESKLIAIEQGDLVIVERPRAVYWKGAEIDIDWSQHNASWSFFWELVRHGKGGQPIDSFAFSNDTHRDFVTKQKSRLTNMDGFPIDLADCIEVVGRGTQQLKLPREKIRVFKLDGLESLREWLP